MHQNIGNFIKFWPKNIKNFYRKAESYVAHHLKSNINAHALVPNLLCKIWLAKDSNLQLLSLCINCTLLKYLVIEVMINSRRVCWHLSSANLFSRKLKFCEIIQHCVSKKLCFWLKISSVFINGKFFHHELGQVWNGLLFEINKLRTQGTC